MGRFGIPTRLAMLVLGAIWVAMAAAMFYYIAPLFFAYKADRSLMVLATASLLGGLAMLKTALTPDRPKTFEDEPADPDPDPLGENWPTT